MKSSVLQSGRLSIIVALFIATLFAPVKHANGQIGDLGRLFEGGAEDAELLLQEYLKPFGSGFGAGINSGWIDRANSHGTLGFHLKFNVNTAMVPGSDLQFDINDLDLNYLRVRQGDGSETPTFAGGSSDRPMLVFQDQPDMEAFRMPNGTDFSFLGSEMIPTVMGQAGVGLPKNTELMLRFFPPVSFGDYGEVSLYGLGAKHELNQWVPGGTFWPVTISAMAGFTRFNSSSNLDQRPGAGYYDEDPENYDTPGNWDDQEISLNTNAFTMNLLVGKSLPILSVYGGVGFETATTNVEMSGNYPTINLEHENGEPVRVLNQLSDPIDISLDGSNTLRALAGVRISLPLITFNVDYTVADYSMLNVGFGISFR